MFRGYKLFKVQSLYSLNLRPISGDGGVWGGAVKRRGKSTPWRWAGRRPAPEEERRGWAGGELTAPPQHLLQANGCYNLINVTKLDIIP